jgi:hypothetical protein
MQAGRALEGVLTLKNTAWQSWQWQWPSEFPSSMKVCQLWHQGAFQSDVALLGCDIQIPPNPFFKGGLGGNGTTLSISSIKTIG